MSFLGIIVKLIEFLIDRFSDYKLKTQDDALEREKIANEAQRNKDGVRGMVLARGAFWFQLFFIIPLSIWFAAVVIYSVVWCQDCVWPQPWTIAALPYPLNDWAGWIVGFLFLAQLPVRK